MSQLRIAYSCLMQYMKLFFCSLLFLLITAIGCVGQTAHPTNSSATLATTFEIDVPLTGALDIETHIEVTVWLIGSNDYDLVFSIPDLEFSGTNCAGMSAVSLVSVVSDVVPDAVQQAVDLGYPACSSTAYSATMNVFTESCGDRSGTECETTWSACGSDWSYKKYDLVCAGDSSPLDVDLSTGSDSDCTSHSECEESM